MLHIFPLKVYFVSVRWLCGLAETQLRMRDQVVTPGARFSTFSEPIHTDAVCLCWGKAASKINHLLLVFCARVKGIAQAITEEGGCLDELLCFQLQSALSFVSA
jgi:hypothetical protein